MIPTKEYIEFAKKAKDVDKNFNFRILSCKTTNTFNIQVKDLFEDKWYSIVSDKHGICKSETKITDFNSREEALLIIKEFRNMIDDDYSFEYIDPSTLEI